MASSWVKRGIEPGSKPSSFSLPVFSSRFLESEADKYGYSAYVKLSKDPDTGRADMGGIMLQNYKDKTVGINLYFSQIVDGCVLRQKGSIQLQIATNLFQENKTLISPILAVCDNDPNVVNLKDLTFDKAQFSDKKVLLWGINLHPIPFV